VALLAVLAVVLAVWAVNGGDPGTATRGDERYADTGAAAELPTPTPAPTTTPTAGAGTPDTPDTPDASAAPDDADVPVVALRDVPAVAQVALRRVCGPGASEGPYRDWAFANGRALLPDQPAGYYRAYAVPLDGSDAVGQLVVGEQDELYWTEDVGRSFVALAR